MTVVNVWHGAMTANSFRVVAKVDGSVVALLVGASIDLATPAFRSGATVPTLGIIDLTASGLQADMPYFYGLEVDGVLDATTVGHTRTFPTSGSPASFTFIASGCAGSITGGLSGGTTFWPSWRVSGVSNSAVFGTIAAKGPLFFLHLGDFHYRNIEGNDPALYRSAYDDVLSAPLQAALYRNTPIAYMWDDHDYGPNDSNKTAPGRPSAIQVYRERVPAYPLHHAEGVWQTFVVGRVRFVMTDLRSMADPHNLRDSTTKSATGTEQEAWLLDVLGTATEALIVWVSTMPYGRGFPSNTWGGYSSQRNRLASWFQDHPDVARRTAVIASDWHGMGFDDGRNNRWGGFPIFQCGPLDSAPSTITPEEFSHGSSIARGQYGEFTVEDTGEDIILRAVGFRGDVPLLRCDVAIQRATPALREAQAISISGHGSVDLQVNYRGDHYTDVTAHVAP